MKEGTFYDKKQKAIRVMKKIILNSGEKGIDIEVLIIYLQENVIFLSNNFFINEIERRNGGEFIYENPIVKWNYNNNPKKVEEAEKELDEVFGQTPTK